MTRAGNWAQQQANLIGTQAGDISYPAGNIALYGANPNNVNSGAMFSPEWQNGPNGAVATTQSGLSDAQTQQQAGSGAADTYDARSQGYQDFAQGAGAQMAPGLGTEATDVGTQGQGAAKAQGQADWLWQNPGYTDAEKTAMSTASATPIAGSYSAAQEDLKNAAARTGNSAAYGAQAGDLARQKAMALSQNALGMQGQFANARIAGQQFANTAQGAATGQEAGVTQAQDTANRTKQAALGVQGNLLNTGVQQQGQAVNNRIGLAGSNIQRGQAGTSWQGANQGNFASSMMPYQLASNLYGQANAARQGAFGSFTAPQGLKPTGLQTALPYIAGGASAAARA